MRYKSVSNVEEAVRTLALLKERPRPIRHATRGTHWQARFPGSNGVHAASPAVPGGMVTTVTMELARLPGLAGLPAENHTVT